MICRLDRRALLRRTAALTAVVTLSGCAVPRLDTTPATKIRRIGFLGGDTPGTGLEGFRKALSELGYVEGRDYVLEQRYAESVPDRLPRLASELAAIPVDLLFSIGGLLPTRAAKNATTEIPIVFTNLADPVEQGIVPNLTRPGANVTGMTGSPGQAMKRLELLKEINAGLSRVVLFGNQNQPGFSTRLRELHEGAPALGVKDVVPVGINTLDELDRALTQIDQANPDAVLTVHTFRFFSGRPDSLGRFLEFANDRRLPQIYEDPLYARAGGLIALGTNDEARWRIVARLIDKIFKGVKPGDIPIEFNSVYDIVLNLAAAKKIGVSFPESVLKEATEFVR